jgi:Phytanoyl-CoA dioxygenase (PhyH)
MITLTPLRLTTIFLCATAAAFGPSRVRLHHPSPVSTRTSVGMSLPADMDAARSLLYQDQQEAMLRRSAVEEELLAPRTSPLEAPVLKATVQRGTGFSSRMESIPQRLATQQAKTLKRDGVLRIDNVMIPELADALRVHVLEQQAIALEATQQDPTKARGFYGVEQARAHRCDLQLSLLRGGYAADNHSNENAYQHSSHVLADALQALLGKQGSLRPLYEKLVTPRGEFYELAAVITDPGSHRQTIHPDLPCQDKAPLYVVFLALQDVTADMGPTSFLLRTQTQDQNDQFTSLDENVRNHQLTTADCRLSCLPKGSAVLFDARILHCGNANQSDRSRALFNFSFRNPAVTGSLGYEGSIRPAYCQAMTLADVGTALESYANGNQDPFIRYGSGLLS